ncbi:MAG: hypothetical protein QXL77_07330 [Candidatus Bathyarchaeia archaeon]
MLIVKAIESWFAMSNVKIRRANENDVSKLILLAKDFMHEAATDEERSSSILKSSLKDPNYELWVAEVEARLLAS